MIKLLQPATCKLAHPTKPIARLNILEPRDTAIGISELHKICRPTDFGVVELLNFRSCVAVFPLGKIGETRNRNWDDVFEQENWIIK